MVNEISEASDYDCGQNLAQVPIARATAPEFFQEIACHCFVAFPGNQMLQHPRCRARRFYQSHLRSPLSFGSFRQSPLKMRLVSFTWRSPAFVPRKYLFALPPRSGAGSPSVKETSPLNSTRSNAA